MNQENTEGNMEETWGEILEDSHSKKIRGKLGDTGNRDQDVDKNQLDISLF